MTSAVPPYEKTTILVIGDIMLDRYWSGSTQRISPEAPVPIVNINEEHERPGGAGNVALNIAALGARSILMSAAGEDEAGNCIKEKLQTAEVTPHIHFFPHLQTPIKLRVLSQHQQLVRLDFEKILDFDRSSLLNEFETLIANVDAVILSDYNKGVLKNKSAEFIAIAKQHKVPVLVDPKQIDYENYRGATLISPNMKEFVATVGPCQTDQDIMVKGQALMEHHDIESLLITRGGNGMLLLQRDQEEHYFPPRGREIFDVTGAGDTVIATLAASMVAQDNLIHAVELASTAAGLVIGKLGAATVSQDELHRAMAGFRSYGSSIVTEEKLLQQITEARSHGEKIIFTNGCFDILHASHVDYLNLAKQLGGRLIVAVNADESITRSKGPGRPVNQLNHRMAVLAGLESVDWVIPFYEETPNRLLELIKPDVLAKGGDYTIDQVVGADIVKAYGGEVKVLGNVIEGVKTSAIIKRSQLIKEQS
jgi:D-beta-D-heptose 7-phosphate kinase/D-beta-D-heptose 1-phosphate adenosyltransferase